MLFVPGDRHGWNSLDGYLTIHDAQLRRLGEYFIDQADLAITFDDEDHLRIADRNHCQNGLFIDVTKVLRINERGQVRCEIYKYHAGMSGSTNRSIFRHDNAHVYAREGHLDAFHRHRFDDVTGNEIAPPVWIGRDNWPTLAEAVDELYEWCQ